MRVLISGCGYVGKALGSELVKSGHEVWGLRRDLVESKALEHVSIKPIRANLLRSDELKNLPSVDTLIICQAPSQKNDEYKTTYVDATKNLLSQFAKGSLRKVLVIGSTSVYSTADGSWVDEATDPMAGSHPDAESRENAKVLLTQEELVLKSGHPAMVFRLAGIYGPVRNRVKAILERRIVPSLTEHYMNRIHLTDIVRGIRHLLDKGDPGNIYLGSDDVPCTQKEFYTWIYEKLSLDLPVETREEKPGRGTNKRCSNKKLRALGFKFRVPSYREGYEPLIAEVLAESHQRGETRRSGWISK